MDQIKSGTGYQDYLHRYGLKSTKARNWVLHILISCRGVLTAEDIYQRLLQEKRDINFSTVYRILEIFTAKQLVEKSYLPSSRKYGFSLRSMGHTHRLICLQCHRTVEIEHCPLTEFESRLAQESQFEIVGHHQELYGYCPECRRQRAESGLEGERKS